MKLARRVNCRTLSYSDLSGGINVSVLPENISDKEMQACNNFMYDIDSATLKKRGGLGTAFATYTSEILGTYNNYNTNQYFVFLKDKSIYLFDDTNSNVRIGTLNGDLKPDCCNFGSKVFIASGSTLQCYDGVNEVFAVTNAPNAALCFVKDNRVCVCSGFTSDPICYMSGIGDGTFWDDNANDDSAATWVQIGNGGCGIYSATPLSNDIIFFMTNGEIHSLSGSYPDWDMNQIAEDSGVDTRLCSVSVGTDVCFVGKSGLRTVSAVQKYSNIETHDIGDKFDSLITSYYSRPRIWKIDRCRSLFISPNYNLQTIIVYNYNLKAATTISFPFVVVDFFENSSGIVVVSPNSLHFFSREYLTDNGTAIDCSLTTKRTVTIYDKLLVSMVDCSFSASTSGSINFKLHSLETSMSNWTSII